MLILVAVVVKTDVVHPTAGLAAEFLDDAGFERPSEQRTVIPKVCSLDAEQRTRQARVGQVELRGVRC
jgi:hypothetical protein